MLKRIIIKIVAIVIAIIFVLSTGFWLGINFSSIKQLSSGNSTTSLLGIGNQTNMDQEQEFSLEPLEEAIDLIVSSSIYQQSKQQLLQNAIEGMLEGLDDKYAEYFSQEEYQEIIESYQGTMSGIGVIVTQDEQERVVVITVIEDTPAFNNGLKEGDIISRVEDEPTQGLSLEKVVTRIKGEEGTDVNLTIYRPSEKESFEVDITRQKFYVPNVFSELIDGNIGYVQYIGFQDMGAEKLQQQVKNLKDEGAEGIILDLRNNLGGILDDAVAVCDLFMDEGTIVIVKGRTGDQERTSTYKAKEGVYTDIPLVVLVNEFSASASELVAGALQESGKGNSGRGDHLWQGNGTDHTGTFQWCRA
ncbi:MAG: S41 family peptidase [Actinomycetota bacterium]|nr:S41 family peptidase [Actinomycetota bacterium]